MKGKMAMMVVGGLALAVFGLVAWVSFALPAVAAPRDHTVERTPARVERGQYLANHVAVCTDCHSKRDWSRYAGPIEHGTFGAGGERFGRDMGLPGELYSANITPTGIGAWTDGELERMITTGVTREGRPIFPIMPYPYYARLCQDDVDAIIAYVRTIEPNTASEPRPPADIDFPVNLIMRTVPEDKPRPPCPDANDEVAKGRYLVNMASCHMCHTKQDKGAPIEGMDFAGGFEFGMPQGGTVRSANISPDDDTGIGRWTREVFVQRFRGHGTPENARAVEPGEFNTIMPWLMFNGMSDEDLGAIYAFLRTVPAVSHQVEKWTPPALKTASR